MVDGATSAFAELFGATAADLKSQSLTDVARPTAVVRQTFDRLRRGEFDYCTIVVEPVNAGSAGGRARTARSFGWPTRRRAACCTSRTKHRWS